MLKLLFIVVMGACTLLTACHKDDNHPVPSVSFDMTIDINLPSYNALTGVGGYAFVNGGSRGIIVYRRAIDDFVAFDRHSPADPEGKCPQPLTPDSSNFLELLDTCNQARFSLYDGSPMMGSHFGLRIFRTVWNGDNLLRIYI